MLLQEQHRQLLAVVQSIRDTSQDSQLVVDKASGIAVFVGRQGFVGVWLLEVHKQQLEQHMDLIPTLGREHSASDQLAVGTLDNHTEVADGEAAFQLALRFCSLSVPFCNDPAIQVCILQNLDRFLKSCILLFVGKISNTYARSRIFFKKEEWVLFMASVWWIVKLGTDACALGGSGIPQIETKQKNQKTNTLLDFAFMEFPLRHHSTLGEAGPRLAGSASLALTLST